MTGFVTNSILNFLAWIPLAISFVVYTVMKYLFQLFFAITTTSLFSKSLLEAFLNRTWMFIGIIVTLKLAISLINYMVNPDEFSNEKSGFGKVVQRTLVTLVMLAFCRYGFNMMYRLQSIIIDTNIIPKIVLGSDNVNSSQFNYVTQSEDLVLSVFKGTFQYKQDDSNKSDIEKSIKECHMWELHKYLGNDGVSYFMFLDVLLGGFIDYVLFLYCIDVSIRSVKLSLYEMLAPIPIIMYIDPKTGNERLTNYLKAVGGTFAEMFVRIGIIYGIVLGSKLLEGLTEKSQVFCKITDSGVTDQCNGLDSSVALFANAFIIVGFFIFAKQFPQLIKDLTGMNFGGKDAPGIFSLHDRAKQVETSGLLGSHAEEAYNEREKHRADQRNARRQQARESRQNAFNTAHNITNQNDPRTLGFLGQLLHPIAARNMNAAMHAHATTTAVTRNETETQQRLDQLIAQVNNLTAQREEITSSLRNAQTMQAAAVGRFATVSGTPSASAQEIEQAGLEAYKATAHVDAINNSLADLNRRIQETTGNLNHTRQELVDRHTETTNAQRAERVATTAVGASTSSHTVQDRRDAANHSGGH
jgi:hypothetical protein